MARRRKRRKTRTRTPPVVAPAPSSEKKRSRTRVVLPLLIAAAAAAGAYWLLPFGESRDRPWNVVLVTADTLRADRLGVYGGPVATPHLARLAENGVVFERATTAAPVTLPAHATLFTGTYPLFHGVRDNGGTPLASRHDTMAESLRDAGYATGAFVAAFVLDARWGLDQGFDVYGDELGESPSEGANLSDVQRPGGEVLEEALAWMGTVADRPFFSWIHLFDPHTPYDPPEPFRRGTSDAELYDGEVAYVDHLVGRLLDWLDERGLADSTVIAFVGDHGESLGEHGEATHGFFVYEETMHVPWILSAPRGDLHGRRVGELVRTIDVLPTLLDLVGVVVPETARGTSLVERERGLELSAYGESFFPAHYGWAPLKSLRKGNLHFIDAPRPELYDVEADPDETENLAASRAGTVRQLSEELRQIEQDHRGAPSDESSAPAVDPETEAKLRALGYVGRTRTSSPDGERADPKDKIHLFRTIREASAAAGAGHHGTAADLLESVLEEDPSIPEAHRMLGESRLAQGDADGAAEAFRAALAIDEDFAPAVFGLATAYRALGRVEDAAAGFERVLSLDERSTGAALSLARIRLEQRRLDEAESLLEDVLELDSESHEAHFLLARLLGERGRSAESQAHLERSIEADPRFALGYLYLANSVLEAGNVERARELASKGLALEPEPSVAVLGHLILADVYERMGRREDAARELARARKLQGS